MQLLLLRFGQALITHDDVTPVLYDLALTIGNELSLSPLLSRTLQRFLYFTSFPVGFICLDLSYSDTDNSEFLEVELHAAVGDYKLVQHVGEFISLPKALLFGKAAREQGQTELLLHLPVTKKHYHAFLRLPIGHLGVMILIAPVMPDTHLPLTRMFEPIMAHLSRAILLCRSHDKYTAQLLEDKYNANKRADFLALHDGLTNLPNRALLAELIQRAITMMVHHHRYGALITLNVEQFKHLNSVYGYELCDQILIEIAQRLKQCIREEDTVARFSGNEFILLIWPLSDSKKESAIQADTIAQHIRETLLNPYPINTRKILITFSIGISLFHGSDCNLESLLKNAEASVSQAKTKGRNQICFFDSAIQAMILEQMELKIDLQNAIQRNEFELYYQAQANIDNQIIGAETLIRWHHPERGMVSPALFIPIVEETGLIVELGDWILRTVCQQLTIWQHNPKLSQIKLAVNISAVQFEQVDFVNKVCALLSEYQGIAHLLKFELTESIMVNHIKEVIEKIQQLKNLGIEFSLDDFGTGYSSLAYLKQLPLDQLKIDQSFVREITDDINAAVITQTIIGMAQNLRLEVIAEGLETQEQLLLLMQYGCHCYQGYLISRPVPVNAFEELIYTFEKSWFGQTSFKTLLDTIKT